MSFLYPRTVSISRQPAAAGGGVQPYSGMQPAQEAVVATGLPASIQLDRDRGRTEANLPSDGMKSLWKIFIPLRAAALGVIQAHDIVTDDLGIRYQVLGPYWNSLGHNLLVQRLEA